MPIKVTCACGQSFAANDALAGKRVKCPKCAQPLQIPGAASAAPAKPPAGGAAQQQTRTQQPRPQQPSPPAPAVDSFASVFDEVGLKPQQANAGPSCPNCRAPMAPGAILCVQCGFNQKLGRVMQTVTTSGAVAGMPSGGHGHGGDVAARLMERAAQSIEEDAEAERSKTSEGFPWYGYLGMLVGALVFMAAMRFIPHGSALAVSGIVIWFACELVGLYAGIRILIAAFTEGIGHGLGCLFCGCYSTYYAITRWDAVGGYFLMAIAANFIGQLALVGLQTLAGAMAPKEEQVFLYPTPRPAHVIVEAGIAYFVPLTRSEG